MASNSRVLLLLLVVGLFLLVVGLFPAVAQTPPRSGPPPLELVLAQLEANFQDYVRSVPNLFCDERVQSAYGPVGSFTKPLQTVTDSTFRLQRIPGPDHHSTLKESRDIKSIDGKLVATEQIGGPSILSGVFGSALGLVSTPETRCMRYKLHPHLGGSKTQPRIVVDFAMLPRRARDPACGIRESEGRAFIDPETMRLRHIVVRTAAYEIVPNVLGEWDWSADYEPVTLSGNLFWLPSTIESTAIPYAHSNMSWTFTAQYSGYHQLSVKSRILPTLATEPASTAPPELP